MRVPIAFTILSSPFTLSHDERWILPLFLGFFALLAVYFAWRLKTEEGDKWRFQKRVKVSALFWLACEVLRQLHGADAAIYLALVTGIAFLYALSAALVYGAYRLMKKTAAAL